MSTWKTVIKPPVKEDTYEHPYKCVLPCNPGYTLDPLTNQCILWRYL